MGQIVHDLAPGAALSFATAFHGEADFAGKIGALTAAGAKVIVDDVAYFEEPFFQDGPVAVAIAEATAKGVSYFSAAGNDNLIEEPSGNEISSWETPEYREAACPVALKATAGTEHCLDFDPSGASDPTFGITVEAGETLIVDLQWAEPWEGVQADLDAYLLDSLGVPLKVGAELVAGTDDNPGQTQRPFELLGWENTGSTQQVQLVINRCFGAPPTGCNPKADPAAMPRVKFALLENGRGVSATEYPKSSAGDVVGPSIYGHAGSAAAIAVAAVPFNDSSSPEPYSSRGPVTHYFGPVKGTAPAAKLTAPEPIVKPDLAATDCGRTTFFFPSASTPGIFRFCGTSAAAPHAAAVAALARQANPTLTPAEVEAGMRATARPVGAFGPDAVGAGLVDAHALVGEFALPPTIAIVERPPAATRNRRPAISFTANRPVSFSCTVDGGAAVPCSSPFAPATPLADGMHSFSVSGLDAAGRRGRAPDVLFRVDGTRPRTFFRIHPRHILRTRHPPAKVVFRFGSNERPVAFTCVLDRGGPRPCPARLALRVKPGRHVLRAFATDSVGNRDATPAVFRFRVERVRPRSGR
jgi:subtilisin family serine protease